MGFVCRWFILAIFFCEVGLARFCVCWVERVGFVCLRGAFCVVGLIDCWFDLVGLVWLRTGFSVVGLEGVLVWFGR